ncbi:MAG: winged helix-turn-helix domain-containing protein [Deltaproteobacteria bacterium]|nr:winged helix-turn-helix domain-containing protein [Deltaproteobacteria bacterium]
MPQDFFFDPFRLDVVNKILWRGEQQMTVSSRAFAVLRYLLEHAGQVVSPREILEAVWPGVRGGMTSLNACIRELQSVLGDETQTLQFIETVQQGYRFTAPVSASSEGSVPARESGPSTPMKKEEEDTSPITRGLGKGLSEPRETAEDGVVSAGFHFDLKGVEPGTVKGNTIQCGALADLIFNYGGLSSETIAKLAAKKLNQLREVNGELGVLVIPRGFTFFDDVWRCTVKFHEGKLEKPAEFHLKATNKPTEDAGVHVLFDTQGCILYEFDIPLRVVESIADMVDSSFAHTPLELDLDEIMDVREQREQAARRRTATLYLWADGSQIHAQFHNHEELDVPSQHTQLSTLDRAKLAAQFERWKDALTPVADHGIWSALANPLTPPSGAKQASAFAECLERVVMAGSSLYYALSQDKDLNPILQAINALKDGSKLSILTDCAFLPWEIFYPLPFNIAWEPEEKVKNFDPQKLWGARFQIECLLMGNGGTWKPPLAAHMHAQPFVSVNLNPTIDDEFRDSAFQPVQSHRNFCESLQGRVAHEIRQAGSDIRKMLRSPDHQATLIYLYCHGQGDQPFFEGRRELLELDQNTQIEPDFLNGSAVFPHGPIVFLNSCSSGALSPLCFSSFLSQFRAKQALGLIATICPIPAVFAAAFGQKLIERYLSGIPLGEALLALRRELLGHGNPLGLFYSLQCHMHVSAPTPPVRRSFRHA